MSGAAVTVSATASDNVGVTKVEFYDGAPLKATDTTRWFAFKDDVVVRVRPEGAGSRVDVRSVSRVGRGDVGTNARRVRGFLEALR